MEFLVGTQVKLIRRAQVYTLQEGPSFTKSSLHKGTKLTCIQCTLGNGIEGRADFELLTHHFVCVQLPDESKGYIHADAVVKTR